MPRTYSAFLALLLWLPASSALAERAPTPLKAETALGSEAMVATAHPLATDAGVEILAAGGNIVDAAVAISFALSVVEPWSSGIGGGAFLVLHKDGESSTWDMRETAPAAASRDMYLDEKGEVIKGASTWTAKAAGIPGLVRGMAAAHQAHGKLPFARVLEPAIKLAKEGFPVSKRLHEALSGATDRLNAEAKAIFLVDGKAPAVGTTLIQADLATTLDAIRDTQGEAFYRGEVARELVRAVKAQGGLWTLEDLAGYPVKKRPPVTGSYRGYDVVSMGPPSSGGLLVVQMLRVLSHFEPLPFGSVERIHRLAEIMKRAFAMRAKGLGDPDFFEVDQRRYIGLTTAKRLADEVKAAKQATPSKDILDMKVDANQRTHTSHFSIVLANGDGVACTQTINLRFGSGRMAGSTGVILNNEMDDFSAKPGAPNAFGLVGSEANSIAPGKRPLSSMSPTLLLKEGKVVGSFGSPGGSLIITTTLQSILNVVDHGMNAGAAIAAPRVHHQWFPPLLAYEPPALDDARKEGLKALGHGLFPRESMGNAMAIFRRPDGKLEGAADPRGEGTAKGR